MKGTLKLFIWILLWSAIVFGCKSSAQNEGFPSCIDSKIVAIKKEPVRNPPAEVWKWQDEKFTFYYITSDCCDQYNYLYNNKCEVVCAPDGGLTGKGDQKCPEFDGEVKRSLIWKDERKG